MNQSSKPRTFAPEDFDLVKFSTYLFDLDGVLTPTAEVHMRAWEQMFNQFLSKFPDQAPYTEADYFNYVDGKPRYEGVASFLKARGIALSYGEPSDPDSAETVCGLGNLKNSLVFKILQAEGVEPYAGSIAFIEKLQSLHPENLKLAVVSSSKNAPLVLKAAGLSELFEVIVDGNVATEENISGKPAPDMFLAAAKKFEVSPAECVVIEDAISGVEAGAAGDFAAVIGVDRGVGAEALFAAGANLVVSDLKELV